MTSTILPFPTRDEDCTDLLRSVLAAFSDHPGHEQDLALVAAGFRASEINAYRAAAQNDARTA